jgi:hypothetical protein
MPFNKKTKKYHLLNSDIFLFFLKISELLYGISF